MIFDILLIISAYLAFFYAIILFLKRNKHPSDYYLASWLIILSVYFIFIPLDPLFSTNIALLTSQLHNIFLFLYIKSLSKKSDSVFNTFLLFIPSSLLIILFCFFPSSFRILFTLGQLAISIIFIYKSFSLLIQHYRNLEKIFSDVEYADTYWLNLLLYGNVFFTTISTFALIYPIPEKIIFAITFFIFMNITGVKAILQNLTFIKRPTNNAMELKPKSSYSNYGLKESEAITLATNLQQSMANEKLYLDQELTLKALAEKLDGYPHYITQVLNTILHKNFYDFVNDYRVEEAKLQLVDPQKSHLTIIAIAFDCGFNSKTAFNRAFKQKTSVTPSQYRKHY